MVKSVLDATLGATSYTKWAGDALVAVLDSSFTSFIVSLVFTTLAFAFLFWVMPNRKVKWRPAFWGGLLTALILKLWMAVCVVLQGIFIKGGAAYGSFALIPILIIWISYNWKIILIGSNMAYAFQCVDSKCRDLPDE
jgi:membrane protein